MPLKKTEEKIISVVQNANTLTTKEKKQLDELTNSLKEKLVETIKNMVSIGEDFNTIKDLLGHGEFMPYVETHFDMSYRTALRFMHVSQALGPYMDVVGHLSQRALYLLSGPSISNDIRQKVIERLRDGEDLTYNDIHAYLNSNNGLSETIEEASANTSNIRIKSFSSGINKLYLQASHGIQEFTGKLTPSHKEQLQQVKQQIQELNIWITKLIDTPDPLPKKRGRKKKA